MQRSESARHVRLWLKVHLWPKVRLWLNVRLWPKVRSRKGGTGRTERWIYKGSVGLYPKACLNH
jgi:hypothetical protein